MSELEAMGLCINRLRHKSSKIGLYGKHMLTLGHYLNGQNTEKDKLHRLPESKIQVGDNVGIFKSNQNFATNALVKGIIYKISDLKVIVSLYKEDDFEDAQLTDQIISLVLDVNEVTYNRYKRVLDDIEHFAQVPQNYTYHLINVLLNYENCHQINANVKRADIVSASEWKWFKADLNTDQQEAIKFCLQQESVGLIHGPPGTGKTMTVCELIYQAAVRGMKILACAGSNIAVDNIVERLSKPFLEAGVHIWCTSPPPTSFQ